MFTNANMNDYNDAALKNDVNKNVNMYIGDNFLEDPIIQEFITQIPVWFASALSVFGMFSLTILLHVAYGVVLCLFGWTVTMLWPLFQEWIEIICAITSIATTATFLRLIYDETEIADQYIIKIKAELAAKDAIIAELKLALLEAESASENLEDEDSDFESNADSDSDFESNADSDSDYDPDLDEY